jgi:Fe2+ transport system protein B
METGLPFALLLNMTDMAEANGVRVDHGLLAEKLGAPVFPVIGTKGTGVDAVRLWLNEGEWNGSAERDWLKFPEAFEKALLELEQQMASTKIPARNRVPFLLRRSLLETGGVAEQRLVADGGASALKLLHEARARVKPPG